MCGIAGYKTFFKIDASLKDALERAVQQLTHRGPDFQDTFTDEHVGLGHTRLSILDTSSNAHQPMSDPTGRYTLVYNGEIYNYQELKNSLKFNKLKSTSDTEVLLHLLIEKGAACLPDLNGFFAFSFYDAQENKLLLARDRMGIKPLYYYQKNDFFAFGSEMKALHAFPIPKEVDQNSLYWYLRLTYLPASMCMLKGVKKLLPGHYLTVSDGGVEDKSYWSLDSVWSFGGDYKNGEEKLVGLIEQSVERRMIADVPLGAFLSGGTDSSVIVAMASKFNPDLHTFSIGYKDHPFFDETHYAELVAEKFGTQHTTFKLSNDDLLSDLPDILNYLDEPFADSSAIPTYILSKRVSESMKVALSGDGADELFGGYYKHLAFSKAQRSDLTNLLLRNSRNILRSLPQSRSGAASNLIRRLSKYADLLSMSKSDQYWRLASFNTNAGKLLINPIDTEEINSLQNEITGSINDLNDFLDADLKLVLPGDMLTKVDRMSMANGLEVRVPFLDKEVVAFARSLPTHFKVNGNQRKRVLQDAFEHILPKELHHRSKKGFEVPLLSWLRNELLEEVDKVVFNKNFLEAQNLFKSDEILALRKKLLSKNPQDVHAILWSVYVFQKWYQKYIQP